MAFRSNQSSKRIDSWPSGVVVYPWCHNRRWSIIVSIMLGSVCTLVIHLLRSFRDVTHICCEFSPLQITICDASPVWPHLGQWPSCHFFHRFIHFPTPHIPTVCLIINHSFCLGRPCIALPMADQVNVIYIVVESLSFILTIIPGPRSMHYIIYFFFYLSYFPHLKPNWPWFICNCIVSRA